MSASESRRRPSLGTKLFGTMLVLAVLLSLLLVLLLFFCGQFSGTAEKYADTLRLQAEFFDREMTSLYNDLTLRTVRLSESAAWLTAKAGGAANVAADGGQLRALEAQYIDLLQTELLKANCSGAFILLNAAQQDGDARSRAGVYLQRDFLAADGETLLLYRGNAQAGKAAGIMPHRKWRLEFNTANFPSFAPLLSDGSAQGDACRICDAITLPGTSERAMLVVLPFAGKDGGMDGLCGFEVSESLFKRTHAQPSALSHITCVFSPAADRRIDVEKGLCSGALNGYYLPPKDDLAVRDFKEGLLSLSNAYGSYIGITRTLDLHTTGAPYAVTVMMPRTDFVQAQTQSTVQLTLILLLLAFAAVSLCLFFSRRFISPIRRALAELKQSDPAARQPVRSNIPELDDLSVFLAQRDDELRRALDALAAQNKLTQDKMARVQSENERLLDAQRNVVSEDDFAHFCAGIKRLTAAEKRIFVLYLEGKNGPEITELLGIKQSTLKYHTGNMYTKLGVSSRKQLLNLAALYADRQKRQQDAQPR